MVTLITDAYSTDPTGRPYRRRRSRPVIIVIVILALICASSWIAVMVSQQADAVPTACPSIPDPKAGATKYEGIPANAGEVEKVRPSPLSLTRVRVLNATSQRGAAATVLADLKGYGFNAADNATGNDPVYPSTTLNCVGQIRFGPKGISAANTIWLAVPCAQLIEDRRPDTSVDLVLGNYFEGLNPSNDAQEALTTLKTADPKNPNVAVDPQLIRAIHSKPCTKSAT